ncbi:MAG: methylated-DNA--[Clostridia bacterium]|nr:methylated-DNA--[protein]-cysteine S-methyltransferase [Clostridia bacterium]
MRLHSESQSTRSYFRTELGLFRITEESGAISEILLVDEVECAKRAEVSASLERAVPEGKVSEPKSSVCARALDWLCDYFRGVFREVDFPIAPRGTDFQRRVWKELLKIPVGETVTYSQLAERIGVPGAARAVGSAVGKNHLLIAVPCHRVLAAAGIGGFSALGGIETKIKLLHHEGVVVNLIEKA